MDVKAKCRLSAPDLRKSSKIYKILDLIRPRANYVYRNHYWNADNFYLDQCSLYLNLSDKDQGKVLHLISQSLLQEAYFIEKAGIAFAAKMTLLSETTQERELYAHFSSQEANHLNLIRPFLTNTDYEHSDFLELLVGLIETGDKPCLTYVIQVLLEGFGLIHYKTLSNNCIEPTLKSALDSILRDEAQHYRSGVELYESNSLTETQRAWIDTAVARFEDHVRKGPLRTVQSILQVYGKVHLKQFNQLLLDIKASDQIKQSLTTFTNLRRD